MTMKKMIQALAKNHVKIIGSTDRVLANFDMEEMHTEEALKAWDGSLKATDNPIAVGNFKTYSREELHER